MAWGGKKAKQKQHETTIAPDPAPRASSTAKTPTLIGDGAKVNGRLDCVDNLTIAGVVAGEIHCEQLVNVAGGGKIEGKVLCREIVIAGIVEGDIDAEEQVTITSTGRLIGDITTRKFSNEPGGFFEGYSHMAQEKRPSGPRETASAGNKRNKQAKLEKEGNKV